jgi:C4-dicarboxylate-specific signal transduction histidine kinase
LRLISGGLDLCKVRDRNGFRIRPLGDPDFDWLKLNQQRVQNPSRKIGSNQVIGFVQIQNDELSGLVEKSARDGLKDNHAFEKLKEITQSVIAKLEEKRFDYRQKVGLSRATLKVERELEKLFIFDELKQGIRDKLSERKIDKTVADEILAIINREAEDKNRIVDEIRQTVAVYQGQATLGKIINVILHEGRKPLNYFKNQIPNMQYWHDSYTKSGDMEVLKKIFPIASGIEQNADVFIKLFGRLDPLAAGKRSSKKELQLKHVIENSFSVFESELEKNKISVQVSGSSDFKFMSWPQDIYAIFTNLADNSIYWISKKNSEDRKISVDVCTDGEMLLYIDYQDSGPGIEPGFIASEVIFEPQFSTKPDGTGLGLAIAGEAASRNGLELKAMESEKGAYFRLQPRAELK